MCIQEVSVVNGGILSNGYSAPDINHLEINSHEAFSVVALLYGRGEQECNFKIKEKFELRTSEA